jgi:putative ABC transport system permease protein
MLVSIKEQISVIGLRKALGAKSYFIFYQFFFESVLLCFMGAFVGILLFFLLTKIRFGFLDLDFKLHNILVAVIVAGLMGIISGIAPALIASKLNPITALKNLDV